MTAEPYCLAMVLCDNVHVDPGTRKTFVLGTFSSFYATRYPAKIGFFVYYCITDGLGPTDIRIQITNARSFVDAADESDCEDRIAMIKVRADFENPLIVLEGAIGMEIVLPAEGLYHCELWADDKVLMSRRLTALVLEQQE